MLDFEGVNPVKKFCVYILYLNLVVIYFSFSIFYFLLNAILINTNIFLERARRARSSIKLT